jgi:IS5 family transposase
MIDASDFFRGRIDQMIDLRHPLAVLASRMPWQEIEASLASRFARRVREGRRLEGVDLFGPSVQVVGVGVSKAGRPRLPMRLMISLLYLKHAFNESDESVVERWSENVVWQFFSGMEYYSPKLPCDPAQLSRFRKILGEAGVEQLLKTTIEAAVAMKAVKKAEFERVIVDTTVQEKAIAHPTDARLLDVARQHFSGAAVQGDFDEQAALQRIDSFLDEQGQLDRATDQLLNALHLLCGPDQQRPSEVQMKQLQEILFKRLSEGG